MSIQYILVHNWIFDLEFAVLVWGGGGYVVEEVLATNTWFHHVLSLRQREPEAAQKAWSPEWSVEKEEKHHEKDVPVIRCFSWDLSFCWILKRHTKISSKWSILTLRLQEVVRKWFFASQKEYVIGLHKNDLIFKKFAFL